MKMAAVLDAPTQAPALQAPVSSRVLDDKKELTPLGLDVLMSAVRMARTYQIQKVAFLKLRLSSVFPDLTDPEFNEVLGVWARHARHQNY